MKHDSAIKRLKTIESHVRGIERRLEGETYCIDVYETAKKVQLDWNC